MRMICGVVVDEELYKKYEKKMYQVLDKVTTLRTIEVYATSKEFIKEEPELNLAAKKICEQVQKEIKEYYAARDGRKEYVAMKHETFGAYVEDLKKIFEKGGQGRAALIQKREETEEEWHKTVREYPDEYTVAKAKVKYVEAIEKYNADVIKLREETEEEVNAVRKEFEKHLYDFYTPNGNRIDAATVELLNSGIKLNDDEINMFFLQNTGNPTMLRILGSYCKKNNVKDRSLSPFVIMAERRGKEELSGFNSIADLVSKVVSENDTHARVWTTNGKAFNEMADKVISTIDNLPVKPSAI